MTSNVWGQVADEKIKPVVSETSENDLQNLLADPPKLEDVLGSELPCFSSRNFILSTLYKTFRMKFEPSDLSASWFEKIIAKINSETFKVNIIEFLNRE